MFFALGINKEKEAVKCLGISPGVLFQLQGLGGSYERVF
jgi:hypothetical protein